MNDTVTFTKYRFFETVDNQYYLEEIEWGMTGTGLIPLNDPRGVSIGESRVNPNTGMYQDVWIPLSIGNCGADISPLMSTYQYETKLEQAGDGTYYEIEVPVKVITPSPAMDIYGLPLKDGWSEITIQQFNQAMMTG